MAGRSSQRAAYREADQEQRLDQLEAQQTAPPAPAAPPQAAAPGGTDVVGELSKLSALHESGSLTDAEFQAAKAKLLGS